MENSKSKIQEFYLTDDSLAYALKQHLSRISAWVNEANSLEPQDGKNSIIDDTISPNLVVDQNPISEETLLTDSFNFLITASPGAGKSVLIKRLLHNILISEDRQKYGVPLFIRARDVDDGSVLNKIKKILQLEYLDNVQVFELITRNKTIVFIDGLDEVFIDKREILYSELTYLYQFSAAAKIISTSRHFIRLANCKHAEILPFNAVQALELIRLNLAEEEFDQFKKQYFNLNLHLNPLLLKSTISIFHRYGQLPGKKTSIYKQWIDSCINDWDQMKRIHRRSGYPLQTSDQKYFLLSYLAFDLSYQYGTAVYSVSQVLEALSRHQLEVLDYIDATTVLDDITTNSGLMIESPSKTYHFIHRSIQEYLAADYLIKLPNIPYNEVISKTPSILALCVLISSSPVYFYTVILSTIDFAANNENSVYQFLLSLFYHANQNEIELFYKITNSDSFKINDTNSFRRLLARAYSETVDKQ
jgi:predicted NACHT family NTPase